MESMTGFASHRMGQWVWTVRSVNAKGLDIRLKLAYDAIENDVRDTIRQSFGRGTFNVSLESEKPAGNLSLNSDFLDLLCRESVRLADRYDSMSAGAVGQLMNVRGVVIENESISADIDELKIGLAQVLKTLKASRQAEGEKMKACLLSAVEQIENLTREAQTYADRQPLRIKATMTNAVAQLQDVAPMAEERLLQEITAMMLRADVREELDRLLAHVQTARELMNEKGAVGRKLDFLCQEFNREANTLCSKSADIDLTKCGLALKSVIDQLREQIQNIE